MVGLRAFGDAIMADSGSSQCVVDCEERARAQRAAQRRSQRYPGVRTEPRIDLRILVETYALTPTECRVATALATGMTVREIAVSTGRSENTVRWHVKNLHSKLGVHRQADVVRLVLTAVDASPVAE